MAGWIGISLGDPSGIGPEVTLKALARTSHDSVRYLLLGDVASVRRLNETLRLNIPLLDFRDYSQKARFFVAQSGPKLFERIEAGSSIAAESAMSAITDAAERCIRGELDAMVTAPLNKEAVIRLGKPFMGQTEYLSGLAKVTRTAMMLLGKDDRDRWLRVALVTTHIPLRAVADALTVPKIRQTIELAAEACAKLGLSRARVAVCGLNPHSGEGGEIGTEEITLLQPAIAAARMAGFDVAGPVPADTLFYYAYNGQYDAVVAMYHDQGLGPLKMIGFESGVNWTLGLPFIRTSPDHGTAYDIVGQNKANPSSMAAAINLARTLAKNR